MTQMPNEVRKKMKAYEQSKKNIEAEKGGRLLKCYDTIRRAAANHDSGAVLEVVKLLEDSLNFEANPVFAWRLKRLYDHIRECVETEQFHEACRVADELHAMWQQGLDAYANEKSEAARTS